MKMKISTRLESSCTAVTKLLEGVVQWKYNNTKNNKVTNTMMSAIVPIKTLQFHNGGDLEERLSINAHNESASGGG